MTSTPTVEFATKFPISETYLFSVSGDPILHCQYRETKNWKKKTWKVRPGIYYLRIMGNGWRRIEFDSESGSFREKTIELEEVPEAVQKASIHN